MNHPRFAIVIRHLLSVSPTRIAHNDSAMTARETDDFSPTFSTFFLSPFLFRQHRVRPTHSTSGTFIVSKVRQSARQRRKSQSALLASHSRTAARCHRSFTDACRMSDDGSRSTPINSDQPQSPICPFNFFCRVYIEPHDMEDAPCESNVRCSTCNREREYAVLV